jgi:hypothetical protein
MTVDEIERKIASLNKLLENEKRKLEENDNYVGKFYKIDNSIIGKITMYQGLPYKYICDEVYWDDDYKQLNHITQEYRVLTEI